MTTRTEPPFDAGEVESLGGLAPCNLRWILVHLIEEYARHNGHAVSREHGLIGLHVMFLAL